MLWRLRYVLAMGLMLGVLLVFAAKAFPSLFQSGYLGTSQARPVILVSFGYLTLAAILSFAGKILLRRVVAISSVAVALVLGLVAALTGHTFLQLLATLLTLITAFSMGTAVLALLRVEKDFSVLERTAMSTALGLGALSHIMVLLGVLGVLYPVVAFTLLALILTLTNRFLLRSGDGIRKSVKNLLLEQAPDHLLLFCGILLFLVLGILQVMAPAIQYDDLNYHLFVPQSYAAAHRLILLPNVIQSYFYQGMEMLYTLAFLIGGETTAIALNGSLGILVTMALAGFAGRVFSRQAAWLTALFWTTTPLVAFLTTTGYVDLGATLFSFLSVSTAYVFIRRVDWRTGLLAGVFAGFAVSSKLSAVLVIVALITVLLVVLWVSRRFRDSVTLSTFYAAGFLASGSVWPMLRFVQTGNPVYPFLNSIFRAAGFPAVNTWFNFGAFGMGNGFSAFMGLPWNMSFHGERFIEAVHPCVLGPCFIIALIGAIIVVPGFLGELRWSIFVVVLSVCGWFMRAQYLRYLIPTWPLVTVIAGVSLAHVIHPVSSLLRRVSITVLCGLLSSAGLVIWLASYYSIPERVPLRVIFGEESRATYRARTLSVDPAFESIRGACYSGSPGILSIGNEFHYLCPKMIAWTAPHASFLYDKDSDEGYRADLQKLGVGYVLVDASGDVPWIPFIESGFLSRAGDGVYSAGGVTVFKILGKNERPKLQYVQAETHTDQVSYSAGLLEPLDPTFEGDDRAESWWRPEWVRPPTLAVGTSTVGYAPANEGKGALHIALAGPSDDRSGGTAVAAFPKAKVQVMAGATYAFSFDLLCSGYIQAPLVRLQLRGNANAGAFEIVTNVGCDSKWRRFQAVFATPDNVTSIYPELGFTFHGEFLYSRYVELDRLALLPVQR